MESFILNEQKNKVLNGLAFVDDTSQRKVAASRTRQKIFTFPATGKSINMNSSPLYYPGKFLEPPKDMAFQDSTNFCRQLSGQLHAAYVTSQSRKTKLCATILLRFNVFLTF